MKTPNSYEDMSNALSQQRRTPEELASLLREQVEFLSSSCDAYDRGVLSEAKRIATAVSVLVHDAGRKSRSLLGQIRLKDHMDFISTSRGLDTQSIPTVALIELNEANGIFKYEPVLASGRHRHRALKFNKWWNEKVLLTAGGRPLSRMNLVFFLRSKDGGSHIDEVIDDEAYNTMRMMGDSRVRIGPDGNLNIMAVAERTASGEIKIVPEEWKSESEGKPIPNAHLATMRQIGWELLTSVDVAIPGLIPTN